MTELLVPGLTCAQVFGPSRSGVLVDGEDFYRAVYAACCKAERSIVMLGWQFESGVRLLHGQEAEDCELPERLVELLHGLCERNPELEVHILAWDASAVFALEREPLQKLRFGVKGHDRVHYRMDNKHPFGASHHQKLVAIDRSIAFVGGMDICNARWDTRHHRGCEPERRTFLSRSYAPYHDVQAYVTGDAVDVLRGWFRDRWRLATGEELPERELPRRELAIHPSFDVEAPRVALARTWPRMEDPPVAPVRELYELHVRAIAAAERVIYVENQYLSSDEIGEALVARMRRGGPPLDLVFVLPEKSAGFKERISIGVYQQRILERLGEAAEATGHRVGVYYQAERDGERDVAVFVHAKVMLVDDRFLLVSSANLSNRSMGFDSELGLAWEAPAPSASIRAARLELLAEHCGLSGADAERVVGPSEGLVDRLDELARAGTHALRMHRRNVDEKPGRLLARLVPDETPFDPDNPRDMEQILPEPGAWLDRVFRDPIDLVRQYLKPRRRSSA